MGETFTCDAKIQSRRLIFWALTFLAGIGLVPHDVVAGVFGTTPIGPILQLVGSLAFVAFVLNAWPVRRTGKLRANRRGVSVDGKLLARRDDIASAYVLGGAKPTARIVKKRFRGAPLDVEVATDADARAVVDALGLGVASSTAVFDVALGGGRGIVLGAVLGGIAAVLVGVALFSATGDFGAAFPLITIAFIVAGIQLSQAKVHVGTDGLLVTRVGRKTFVPFSEIERIDVEGGVLLQIVRHGGRPLRVGFSGNSPASREAGGALLRRIEDARATFDRGEPGARVAAQLERGRRSTRDWVTGLRRLVEAGQYREAAALPDRLYRIVEDPSQPEAARAGAAVALGPVLDARGRARLRVAAKASASPRLRIALECASEKDAEVDALEEALASIEPEAEREAESTSS